MADLTGKDKLVGRSGDSTLVWTPMAGSAATGAGRGFYLTASLLRRDFARNAMPVGKLAEIVKAVQEM